MASDLIDIGDEQSGGVWLDPAKLLDTRLLLVANSGGGKSYALRGLIEGVVEKICTFVIDPEGEYTSLREKFDLVIVGPDGDIPVSIATAAQLARKLIEMRVSAVIDLSELSKADRRKFVRVFLEALLALPKSHWLPTLVMLDEAHDFAPESGDAESINAVVALMCQGRKRRLGGNLATQRLSKLSKDAIGECNNIMLGRCSQDTDLARGSNLMGFTGRTEWPNMRSAKPGQFYAVGPAFSHDGVRRFRTRRVTTTHDPAERAKIDPPKPSKRILSIVGELAELQQQAEAEQSELEQLRSEVARLRSAAPAPDRDHAEVDRDALERARQEGVAEGSHRLASTCDWYSKQLKDLAAVVGDDLARLAEGLETASTEIARVHGPAQTVQNAIVIAATVRTAPKVAARAASPASTPSRKKGDRVQVGSPRVGNGAKRAVLTALVQHGPRTRRELGLLTCLVSSAGSFGNVLTDLRGDGWIRDVAGKHMATPEGTRALGQYAPLPKPGRELAHAWASKFRAATRKQFDAILAAGPRGITRAELGKVLGMAAGAGSFGNNLGTMRGQGVMIDIGSGPGRHFAIDPLVTGKTP